MDWTRQVFLQSTFLCLQPVNFFLDFVMLLVERHLAAHPDALNYLDRGVTFRARKRLKVPGLFACCMRCFILGGVALCVCQEMSCGIAW